MTLASPTPRQIAIVAVVAAVTLALPFVFPVEHHFPWDDIPGFHAMYGAAGCAVLVIFAKS